VDEVCRDVSLLGGEVDLVLVLDGVPVGVRCLLARAEICGTGTARAMAAGGLRELRVLGVGAVAGALADGAGAARAPWSLKGVLLGGLVAVAVEGVLLAAGAGGFLGCCTSMLVR